MNDYLKPKFGIPITDWRKCFAWLPKETTDKGHIWLCPFWERTCVAHDYLRDGAGEIFMQRFRFIQPPKRKCEL
jgi:hypothetical protein